MTDYDRTLYMASPMIRMDAYKRPDGSLDWSSYKTAQIENGEYCHQCRQMIVFQQGARTLCDDCKRLTNSEEFRHSRLVRCPECTVSFDPTDADYMSLYRDGDHDVACPDCSFHFSIQTHISYTFVSPALTEKGKA